MTAQYTVIATSPVAEADGCVAQVIASLPVSLHPSSSAGADLVAVDGEAGWTERAERAIRGGAGGVMVINPGAEDVTSLREASEAMHVPVVVDATWTYNPAVEAGRSDFSARNDHNSLLEARVDVPVQADMERVLLAQLSLIRAAVDEVVSLRFVRRDRHGYDALARLSSAARVSLTAVATDSTPSSAYLRIIKPDNAVESVLPSPVTAIPGRVTVSGPDGATLLTTKWETAHRTAWRRLHRLVQTGRPGTDLRGFARDVFVVQAAT